MNKSPALPIALLAAATLFANATARADAPPAAPAAGPAGIPWTIPELLKHVPPLTHDNTGRFPMICIEGFKLTADDQSYSQAKPFPPDVIRELKRRGLTQWIPPREQYIPFALALQKEGTGVIMMEGQAFNGPGGDNPADLHILPADFKRDPKQPAQQPRYPCPLLLDGWQKKADELRATFRKFKDAGVKVDAVWLDWEVEPYAGQSQWNEAKACSRCRAMFPPGILDDFDKYRGFIERWREQLFSAYFVAPILESYPSCSVTNWEQVISTAERPTHSWGGKPGLPPASGGMFTAMNPVAYGDTYWYDLHWDEMPSAWPLDVAHMDRLYTQVMFGEVSDNAANTLRASPEKQSIPWVDRYCPDNTDPKIPTLSRERYREILRHLWLRGVSGMQIFNPNWSPTVPAKLSIVTEEVEDAQSVYDEMLAYRKLLDSGTPMNLDNPAAVSDGPIWSGLRLGGEAVVRGFTQGAKPVDVSITPFDGAERVAITCPPGGATYLLKRDGARVTVTAAPGAAAPQ